jgi:hypothetical protein
MEGRARLARIDQELHDGPDRDIGHTGGRPDGRSLAEHGEDLDALGERELVHAPHDMNFLA